MTTQTEVQQKVLNWLEDVDRQELFVNGTADQTVVLRDGRQLKTMAKLENEAQIQVDLATTEADRAEEAADASAQLVSDRTVGPIEVDGQGNNSSPGFTFFWKNTLRNFDQVITALKIASNQISGIEIVVAKLENDGTLSFVSSEAMTVVNGVSTVPVDVQVPAGCVAGVWSMPGAGTITYKPGAFAADDERWYTPANVNQGRPANHTPKVADKQDGLQFQFVMAGSTKRNNERALDVSEEIGGVQVVGWDSTAPTGQPTPNQYALLFFDAAKEDGTIRKVNLGWSGGSQPVIYIVERSEARLASQTAVHIVSTHALLVAQGNNHLTVDIPIQKGQSILLFGSCDFTANVNPTGQAVWYKNAPVAEGDILTFSQVHAYSVNFEISYGQSDQIAQNREMIDAVNDRIGSQQDLGWANVVGNGDNVPTEYSAVLNDPVTLDGFITEVRIGAVAAGKVKVHVVNLNTANGVVDIVTTSSLDVNPGLNSIKTNIAIAKGQRIAFENNYKFQNGNNPTGQAVWYKANSGPLVDGSVTTLSVQHRYEIAATVKSGLLAALDGTGLGSDAAGLTLLDGADPTGNDDATALFAAARAAHPAPYVRPGRFATTGLPVKGDGFWGPGKVYVGGKRFFIPRRPGVRNLQIALRSIMAEHMALNNVLAFIGDSITHWAFASTGEKHPVNMLTDFVNLGVCDDEPIMTALRPLVVNNYFPTFYGVTEINPNGITTGNTGPIHESAILAAGSGYEFQGALEQVDMFYQRKPGAGQLQFLFNGNVFKTVDCSGTASPDEFTAVGALPSAANGIYRVVAVGGPVEVTGLVRLGVRQTATWGGEAGHVYPRLRTGRFAHGGYAMSDFTGQYAAQMASVIKQCKYAGGQMVPVFALGTNDSPGSNFQQIAAAANALIDLAVADNPPRMYAILPVRVKPTQWGTPYTANFDSTIGALRRVYRQRGVVVLNTDVLDYDGEGKLADGLHPNDEGFDDFAQIEIEGMVDAG